MNIETAGQKLKKIRIRSRKSIDELIQKTGISYDVYMSMEHDTNPTDKRSTIETLAKFFGCRDSDITKG